jgi:hypothetical protein
MSSALSSSSMFAALVLAEQATTQRGAKYCNLSINGAKVLLQPTSEPVVCPFGPGNFDKDAAATRLTLEMRCNSAMTEHFDKFDAWAKAYLLEHSDRLFGKSLTRQQIEEGYHPTIRRNAAGTYAPNLRTKIDVAGRREVTYWTPEGVKREAPEDWSRVTVVPALEISNLWIMGRELGWVIQCTHLRVYEESTLCPFAAGGTKIEPCPW